MEKRAELLAEVHPELDGLDNGLLLAVLEETKESEGKLDAD